MKSVASLALLALSGCASASPGPEAPALDAPVAYAPLGAAPAHRTDTEAPPAAPLTSCRADADCGYDPAADRCSADPRANRQPKLLDQGIVCYCEAEACAILRVAPVACEGDDSCAVRLDPRPHPVAASAAHPHERGRPCVDFARRTTCERTNICTMHDLGCAFQPGSASLQQRTPSE